MSQQKNKKDNRDSDYGSTTDTQSTGTTKSDNEKKLDSGSTSDYPSAKKSEDTTTDSTESKSGSDKKNLGELEQQISKSSTKSDFGSDQKKDKTYDDENRH